MRIHPDKRHAVAEFLMRVNSGMILDNWEMDYGDDEVSYKTSNDVMGDRLTSQIIKNQVYVNCRMMDKYLLGICQVIFCDMTPREAVERIEQEP